MIKISIRKKTHKNAPRIRKNEKLKLTQMTPRAKMSWCWWLRKSWTYKPTSATNFVTSSLQNYEIISIIVLTLSRLTIQALCHQGGYILRYKRVWCLMAEDIVNKHTILGFASEKHTRKMPPKIHKDVNFDNRTSLCWPNAILDDRLKGKLLKPGK